MLDSTSRLTRMEQYSKDETIDDFYRHYKGNNVIRTTGMEQETKAHDRDDNKDPETVSQSGKPRGTLDTTTTVLNLGNQTIKISFAPMEEKPAEKSKKKDHPQVSMNNFWTNFNPEYNGKITKVLPEAIGTSSASKKSRSSGQIAPNAVQSYEVARDRCLRDVRRIIRECRSLNQKYTDTHFDIERDLKITDARNCLEGLLPPTTRRNPVDAKRVTDIFKNPKFFVDGAHFDDIIQGSAGDCWFLSALSTLSCNQEFVDRVCVHHDQDVGVYGFLFYRDGEWHQCIIDDKLYLRAPSYDESDDTILGAYGMQHPDQETKYKELFQQGSRSLYFAQCRNENETWVPLLEKAYAKAHGDYNAIHGGQTGEALEDLTGGVTTEIYTTNILNTDKFWEEELLKIGKDFLFSCAVARWKEWRPTRNSEIREERRNGIVSRHAYAVLDAYEGYGQRLVKIRNPWGKKEWTGAWSDGSKEWTAEWLTRLNHQFGDDGVFWMRYEDLLEKYKYIDRTRIFGRDWHVAQQWMTVQVPWSTLDYQETRFTFHIPETTPAVIVLSQLDDRYFQGLEGKYFYTLQFRIQKDDDEDEYLTRTRLNYELYRSVNIETELEPGTYTVLIKVEAYERSQDDIEAVIRKNIKRKEKLTQIGKLYDIAHRKAILPATPIKNTETKTKGEMQSLIHDEDSSDSGSESSTSTDSKGSIKTPSISSVGSNTTSPSADDDDSKPDPPANPDDPNKNPWNAACVIGLRVYTKQAEVKVDVMKPSKNADKHVPILDTDDIAKSALAGMKNTDPGSGDSGKAVEAI